MAALLRHGKQLHLPQTPRPDGAGLCTRCALVFSVQRQRLHDQAKLGAQQG